MSFDRVSGRFLCSGEIRSRCPNFSFHCGWELRLILGSFNFELGGPLRESVWGSDSRAYVIAEVGLNHNGDSGIARRLIEVAADCGADAVKFQKRHVSGLATESTLDQEDLRFPSLGATYRELRETHELSADELEQLKSHAEGAGLDFFVTPFDVESLKVLIDLRVSRFKVASHGVTNLPLLRAIADEGKPVLMSTGMATRFEVDVAVEILQQQVSDLALLHCVSSYPTPVNEARLDLIQALKNRYGLPVGYSGHEVGFVPTLVAVAAGATIIERHITLDSSQEGFDHRLSLEPSSFRELISWVRLIPEMFGSGPKAITKSERVTRDKYQVSAVAATTLYPGTILSPHHVVYKNPGTGLTPFDAQSLFGREVQIAIEQDELLDINKFRH